MDCGRTGFQKLDKIKDVNRQSKQMEDLTAKMREAKRCPLLSLHPPPIPILVFDWGRPLRYVLPF